MSEFLKPQSPLQHKDGAYIYPLTTADQIIMDDGSRLSASRADYQQNNYPRLTARGYLTIGQRINMHSRLRVHI